MTTLQDSAQRQLRQFIERVERVDEDIKNLADDRKQIFAEAKGTGFDVRIMKKVIARRKRSRDDVQEEDAIMQVYLHALGETPMEAHIRAQEEEIAA